MKQYRILSVVIALIAMTATAFAAAPSLIPLQGVLTDTAGDPINGEVLVSFALYGQQEATEALWNESQTLTLTEGVFAAYLGSSEYIDPSLFRDNNDLWLGITVSGDSEMDRIYLGSVPFAQYAEYAANLPEHSHDFSELSGTEAVVQGVQTCEDGQKVVGVGSTGQLLCVADNDTLYYSGTGIMISENVISANLDVVQARIVNQCPEGQYLRAINNDGSVVCSPDADTLYDGSTFVPSGQLCDPGYMAVGFSASGNIVCNPVDEAVSYDAAADMGLELNGTSFGLLSSCAQGQVLKYDGSAWACAADDDALYDGGDFAVSDQNCDPGFVVAGITEDGLLLCRADADSTYDGGTFALSNQACPDGQKVAALSADGMIVCAVDTDNDTTYSGADFALSNQNCPAGQVARGINPDGSLNCIADQVNTYDGSDFAVSGQNCPDGQKVAGINGDGTVACIADTDTTYSGNDFATSGQSCPAGQKVTGVNADGTVACAADANSTYDGADFATSGQTCPAGQKVTGINENGTVACAVDIDTTYNGRDFAESDQTCLDGYVSRGFDSDGRIECIPENAYDGGDFALSNQNCAVGNMVTGINANGAITCGPPTGQPAIGWDTSGSTTDIATICTHYSDAEVTVNASGAGTVMVFFDTDIYYYSHVSGTTDRVRLFIGTSATNCPLSTTTGYYTYSELGGGNHNGTYQRSTSGFRRFTVSSAGNYTYYLNGIKTNGSATPKFYYANLHAVFYPN